MKQILLLINLFYEINESPGHIIYKINENDTEKAKEAVSRAWLSWITNDIEPYSTIEDLIEEEFNGSAIPYETMEYAETDCDMSTY